MSDFYQILKREIEPDNSPLPASDKEAVVLIKKLPVENSTEILKKIGKKKNSPLPSRRGREVVKKNIEKKSRTINEKTSYAKATADKSEKKSGSGFLSQDADNPIWLTMAEAAKLGGIQKRTIKRAVRAGAIRYRIVESRYQVDLRATLLYFLSKKKLWNKLNEFGIGQYVQKWKE
jgi:hypothetical protein